jgi:hypothetical protein
MSDSRPEIPKELERQVLMEAGHRCAIPTCRHPTTEMAHIIPWAQVKEHKFDNLIALCPNCHTRYDRREIDRKAMLQYKANLSIVNGRYGEIEQRILKLAADQPGKDLIWLPGGLDIMVMNLLQDGFLEFTPHNSGVILSGIPSMVAYRITPSGQEFVNRWISAKELD